MKKILFLSLLLGSLLALCSQRAVAQDFLINESGGDIFVPLPQVNPNASSPNYVNICQLFPAPAAGNYSNVFRTIAPILCGHPVFTVTDMDTGIALSNNSTTNVSYGYVNATLQLLPQGETSNSMQINYYRAGRYRVRATWNCGLYTEYRDLYITVTNSAPLQDPSRFTLTNVSNCASPYTGFTIKRTNPSNPIVSYFLDISQCDVSGTITPNGQYWQQPANGTSTGGWTAGNMTSVTPTLPSNFFVAGRYYKVKLAVSSKCNGWESYEQVLSIKNAVATPVININNSTAAPVETSACGTNAIMLNNTNSTSSGACGYIEIQVFGFYGPSSAGVSCGSFSYINGITVAPFTTYDLRNTAGANFKYYFDQGGIFKVRMRNVNNAGTGAWSNEACFVANVASDATFCFAVSNTIAPSGKVMQTNWTPSVTNTVEIGPLLSGLTPTYSKPAQVSSYKIEITEHTIAGFFIQNIYDSGNLTPVPCPITGAPTPCNITFADKLMGPAGQQTTAWFFSQATANPTAFAQRRFKVKLSVTDNQCGTVSKETFIRFRTSGGACPTCRQAGGNTASFIEGELSHAVGSIAAYPNPATNDIQFKLSLPTEDAVTLQILDINGKIVAQPFTVFSTSAGESQLNYNVEGLNPGMYFYTLKSDTQYLSGKFIKQ